MEAFVAPAPISKGPTSQSSLDSAYTRATYNHIQSIINTSPSPHSDESTAASIPQAPPISISPKLRISLDQPNIPSSSKWQENISIERRNTVTSIAQTEPSITLESFDDNILKALCELDCGVPLLLDRIKQSMVSCREASMFLKKRAMFEEEYGKSMQKLARTSSEVYSMNDGKAGTFVTSWQASMRIHEVIAENRFRFAQRLNDISEGLINLCKLVEKSRKETKELATRYERALTDAEVALEKARTRHDNAAEELERLLIQKEGESVKESGIQNTRSPGGKRAIGKAVAKGGLLLKGKNPANLQRQEDDVRMRVSAASNAMAKAIQETQAMRQEYFNFQLPRILRALKEGADEIDNGLQYHLGRYAFLFESLLQTDGATLAPLEPQAMGLRAAVEVIDNRNDFKVYMQHYAVAHVNAGQKVLRREGPWQEGFIQQPAPPPPPPPPPQDKHDKPSNSHSPSSLGDNNIVDKGMPTFQVDLSEQMTRDRVDVPRIMQKCCEAIEKYGLQTKGIYRLSGTLSKIQKLRELLDKDIDAVDLNNLEWTNDINNVTGVLKLWFRELPEPLLTHALHQGFIDAAKIDIDRMRHIRLHERVNDLPDANYATLKYFLGHLHKILQHSEENQMNAHNLSIVFGPTLFGFTGATGTSGDDTNLQNKAIETVLEHYTDIFVDESDPS